LLLQDDHILLNGDFPVNGSLLNGDSSSLNSDSSSLSGEAKVSHVLVEEVNLPRMENGVIQKSGIVTMNGDGPCKRSSSSSEDDKFDNGGMCNGNRDSVESFSMPIGNSLPSVREAWLDMNNDTTHSDISELSLPDSLLAEMGSDGHSVNSFTTNSFVSPQAVNVDITKQRSKSESPSSSLKRSRKISAPNFEPSVPMEIKSVEDEDNAEDFSLRRSKYAPIRRKRNSISGSNPSKSISENFDDLGPLPTVLGRVEENFEGEMKLLEPVNKPVQPLDVLDGPVNKVVDKPAEPVNTVNAPVVNKGTPQTETKPPTSDDKSSAGKQRRRSVKGLFTRKSSTSTQPVKTITEQAEPVKVKKATRRVPLRNIVSRLSPKRDVPPSKTNNTTNTSKKDIGSAGKPPIMKKSLSGSSLLKRQTDGRGSTKSDKFPVRKSSAIVVTKEPIKSSRDRTFSSREASNSVESLLSDGSTDILMAHSSQELCAFSSREDLLDGDIGSSLPSDQDNYSLADEISIQTQTSEATSEKQDTSSLLDDENSRGPSPVIVLTSPKGGEKTLEAAVDDERDCAQLYKAKSMEVLSSADPVVTEVAVHTSTVPTSNLPNTVSVSTESLTSSSSAQKKGIVVSTVKKCNSLDILAASKQTPTTTKVTTISVTSRRTPTKAGLPPLATSVQKMEVKKEDMAAKSQEKEPSIDGLRTPAMTRQNSGRKVSTGGPSFQRTNSRSSFGRKKSMSTTPSPAIGQGTKTTNTSPAKKTTTITIKSTKSAVTATPVKVSANVNKTTSTTSIRRISSPTKSTNFTNSNLKRVSSPTKSANTTNSSFRRVSSPTKSANTTNSSFRRVSSPTKSANTTNSSFRRVSTPTKSAYASNSLKRVSSPTKSHTTSNSTAAGARRVTSPTRSSLRRSSVQRTSGRKKSVNPTSSVKSSTPSPVPPKVSFMSLFDSEDGRRITRVSSDEVANNGNSNADVVHGRSMSEIVTSGLVSHTAGLTDIVENQLLATSVDELDNGRVASAMSDTTTLNNKTIQQSPMRRISSVPLGDAKTTTTPKSQGSPQRKKSSTGVQRPINVLHGSVPKQHSDSSLKRPISASTRRPSSTMRPGSSGTLPRALTKTKSDSKLNGIATLPRTHKTSTDHTSAADKKPTTLHSAAFSRGGPQSTRSSNRKLSMAPTSSAGRFIRTSSARRSKSTTVRPDSDLLHPNTGAKDEVDSAAAVPAPTHNILGDVKPKNPDTQRKNSSSVLRSSMRRTSALSKSADSATLNKESRQSVIRSSRRSSSHTVTSRSSTAAQSSGRSTPSKRISIDHRPSNSAVNFSTPKNEPSLSMSDLDSVKSADRYVVLLVCVFVCVTANRFSYCYPRVTLYSNLTYNILSCVCWWVAFLLRKFIVCFSIP